LHLCLSGWSGTDFSTLIYVSKHHHHHHTKVEELKLNNEYQLKLKEMTYSEKVKEINGKLNI
jgi:hypothetical protein